MRKVVARGSIRVDARRAVEKLREHLLLDLHLYPLEIVRAAVAGGATAIDVAHDADGVTLTFDGDPLPPEVRSRLLDHVLDIAPEAESRRRRLLALGVNAALGLDPASVDVISADATGAVRVRWTPALLAMGEDDQPAPLPEPEPIPTPAGMAPGSIRVDIRKRFGWGVIRKALTRERPREILLLIEAVFALPVAITLGGRPFPAANRPRALVRTPFDLAGARTAVLEIVPARGGVPTIELLEHGVCLLRGPLAWALALRPSHDRDAELPIRIVLDAEVLPTNVSRSALQEDATLARRAEDAALPAFRDAVRALAAAVSRRDGPPEALVDRADPDANEAALAAIVATVMSMARAGVVLPVEVRSVLDLKVFESGYGERFSPRALLADKGAIPVWRGVEPIPEALRLWIPVAVWLRDARAERWIAGLPVTDVSARVEQARGGLARRTRWLAQEARAPALEAPRSGAVAVRVPFAVKTGDLAGLSGELAVFVDPGHPRRAHVFIEGRPLETIDLDPAEVPLPIEVALTWEGKVRPRLDFEGVERDDALPRALAHVGGVALFALDHEARLRAAEPDALARLAPVLRAAIAAAIRAPKGRGGDDAGPLPGFEGLSAAPIWPTTEPDRRVSVTSLATLARGLGALFVAAPDARGRAADGRPVLALPRVELAALAVALFAEIVPYDDALIAPGGLQAFGQRREDNLDRVLSAALDRRGLPVLSFVRPGVRGRIAPSADARVIWCHAGRTLDAGALPPSLGPVTIVIDDDTLVPDAGWTAHRTTPVPSSLEAATRALCVRIVAVLEGAAPAPSPLGEGFRWDPVELGAVVRVYLLACAAGLRAQGREGGEDAVSLRARIEALPLVTVLDERGAPVPDTLAAVDRLHPPPGMIPGLAEPPGFETLGWRPLLVRTERERWALRAWSLGRLEAADAELPLRLLAAQADRARRAFLARPAEDPGDLADLADRDALTASIEAPNGLGIRVVLALPRASSTMDHAVVDLLFHGRPLRRRELRDVALPVVARVDLTADPWVHELRDLSPLGAQIVGQQLHLAAERLALALLARAAGPGKGAAFVADPRALRLLAALLTAAPREGRGLSAMLEAPVVEWLAPRRGVQEALLAADLRLPTVQGEEHPLPRLHGTATSLFTGCVVHAPWRGPGEGPAIELDRPILHAPDTRAGAALRALCAALKRPARDVTEAVAKLQARRAASGKAEVLRLSGAPIHPALRVNLASLGLPEIEGELEIIEGPDSTVILVDPLDDTPRVEPAALPFSVRIIARAAAIDAGRDATRALVAKLARAAVRHLLSLVPRFDELPGFVRATLRSMVCKAVAHDKKVQKRATLVPLFEDVRGRMHALDALRAEGSEWGCTSDPPPYPERLPAIPVLRLSEVEMTQLAGAVRMKNLTRLLRRRREGEQRAAAPPRAIEAVEPPLRAIEMAEAPPRAIEMAEAPPRAIEMAEARAPEGLETAGIEAVRVEPPPRLLTEDTWIESVIRTVSAFLGREELLPGESPIAIALLAIMRSLDLPRAPVEAVAEARVGRPIRYDPAGKKLILHLRHPALAWLREEHGGDPRALALIAAAALTEIDRALEAISDDDERRALIRLLARLAPRTTV